MKKLLLAVLLAMFVGGLCGCKKEEPAAPKAPEPPPVEKEAPK